MLFLPADTSAGKIVLSSGGVVLQRIISALVLAPVVLLIVWAGGWWVTGLIALAVVIGIRELVRMLRAGKLHPRPLVASAIGLGFIGAVVLQSRTSVNLIGAVLAIGTIGALMAEIWRRDRSGSLDAWAITLASAVYVGGLLTHFILLRELNLPGLRPGPLAALRIAPGAAWIYATFAVTWAADSGAYFAGRAFGRNKMSPLLSPKKTWEGFAGGLLAAIGAGVGIVALLGLPVSLAVGAALGIIGAVGGTFGDLAESMLKRQAGVKDSGALIPGHGGLLDRIDSLLFTGPLVYYLLVAML
jgi:phosphatidate cytidylyltransferase